MQIFIRNKKVLPFPLCAGRTRLPWTPLALTTATLPYLRRSRVSESSACCETRPTKPTGRATSPQEPGPRSRWGEPGSLPDPLLPPRDPLLLLLHPYLPSDSDELLLHRFNTENEELYGMMLYHRNRLIKPYLRVGIQQEANSKVRRACRRHCSSPPHPPTPPPFPSVAS